MVLSYYGIIISVLSIQVLINAITVTALHIKNI